MAIDDLMKAVDVKTGHHTANSMGILGNMLEMSVEAADPVPAPLPEPFPKMFKAYFHEVHIVKDVNAQRQGDVRNDPRLVELADKVRAGFSVLFANVHNAGRSLVEDNVKAVEDVSKVLPENLEMLKGKRHHWMGQMEAIITVLHDKYQKKLELIGSWKEVLALHQALLRYQRLFMSISYRKKVPEGQNLLLLLASCRRKLQSLVLGLVAFADQNPEYVGQIEQILQPYFNQLEMSKRKKKTSASDGSDNSDDDASNDNSSDDGSSDTSASEDEVFIVEATDTSAA